MKTEEYFKITKEGTEILKSTFSIESDMLPSISFLKKNIQIEDWKSYENFEKLDSTYALRQNYVKHNFSILSHEFISTIKNIIKDLEINNVAELSCGEGWFTYWLKRYGISVINCIDDMSWKAHARTYLKTVKRYDSVKYVEEHPEVRLFILSWNYMDNVAYNIWRTMKSGQYLLYIGEGYGGCTASDEFFNDVQDREIEDKWNLDGSFISFWGIHDRPIIYLK